MINGSFWKLAPGGFVLRPWLPLEGSRQGAGVWRTLSCAFPSNACLSPFPKEKDLSPLYAAAAKSLQLCPALCDPIDSRDSPGKNTGVGCHFLLQCMKVKSESEVSQSCPTLSDPMGCSLPGSSFHGIFQARVLEWGAIAFSVPPPPLLYSWDKIHTTSNDHLTILSVWFSGFKFIYNVVSLLLISRTFSTSRQKPALIKYYPVPLPHSGPCQHHSTFYLYEFASSRYLM